VAAGWAIPEIVGDNAIGLDRKARFHSFRKTCEQSAYKSASKSNKPTKKSYAQGVNLAGSGTSEDVFEYIMDWYLSLEVAFLRIACWWVNQVCISNSRGSGGKRFSQTPLPREIWLCFARILKYSKPVNSGSLRWQYYLVGSNLKIPSLILNYGKLQTNTDTHTVCYFGRSLNLLDIGSKQLAVRS